MCLSLRIRLKHQNILDYYEGESTPYVRRKNVRSCFVIKSIEKRPLEAATDIRDNIKIRLFRWLNCLKATEAP